MKLSDKILIVSAKWPGDSACIDGGDVTLRELITSLQQQYCLDLICFRNDKTSDEEIFGIRKLIIHHDDFAQYQNYSLHNSEKFLCRIRQSEIAVKKIEAIAEEYDYIIVQHVMFLLKLPLQSPIWEKCILLPMFTGVSYAATGEQVPEEYTSLEKICLNQVRKIVTPSYAEFEILVNTYNVLPNKISVIPRPVRFVPTPHEINPSAEVVNLIYIAAVRTQKNHIAAMKVVKYLLTSGRKVVLYCVGNIQDKKLHQECLDFLIQHKLTRNVVFTGNLTGAELQQLMQKCDINISVSRSETFGRGIYEGMAAGVPTIILKDLESLIRKNKFPVAPIIAKSLEHMSQTIDNLLSDANFYKQISTEGLALNNFLDFRCIAARWQNIIQAQRGNSEKICCTTVTRLAKLHTKDSVHRQIKEYFIRKNFSAAGKLLENIIKNGPDCSTADLMNAALIYHLLGDCEKSSAIYAKLPKTEIWAINFSAFCHRYFHYQDLFEQMPQINADSELKNILSHNIHNYYIATGCGNTVYREYSTAFFSEQILNDLKYKTGQKLSCAASMQLAKEYKSTLEIEEQQIFSHKRKRIGIFVTDVQRHRDSAILFEIVDILNSECDVYVYFNNIKFNKLVNILQNFCTIRSVNTLSFEEVNNLLFDDEIEVLIDMAEHGLRNNSIALSAVNNVVPVNELLLKYPLLLSSQEYFSPSTPSSHDITICVLGDMRVISTSELCRLRDWLPVNEQIVFESHSFDEPLFEKSFKKRLSEIGFQENSFILQHGIVPFKDYIAFLSSCKIIVIPNGASHVELSEALYYGQDVIVLSDNHIIKKMVNTYGLPTELNKFKHSPIDCRENGIISRIRMEFLQAVKSLPSMFNKRVKERNTCLTYKTDCAEYAIQNTCNGDIVVFCDEEIGL